MKYISYRKFSKQKKRILNDKWHPGSEPLKPVTRCPENPKTYKRNQKRDNL
jgi:hypothetical protein